MHSSRNRTVEKARKERANLESEESRLIGAIKNGIPAEEIPGELEQIAQRLEEIDAILNSPKSRQPWSTPRWHPSYFEEIRALRTGLTSDEHQGEAAERLRNLIDKIVLTPIDGEDRSAIDLYGDLAEILAITTKKPKPSVMDDLGFSKDKLVAGAGFEPTTFGL